MERDFKGVWIPKDLYLNKSLSWTEKILLVEIESLTSNDKGCFASNKYLGEFLGISEGSCANMISKLKKLELIEYVFFDGRNRGIKLHKNMKAAFTKLLKASQKNEGKLHKKMKEASQKNEHNNTDTNKVENTNTNDGEFDNSQQSPSFVSSPKKQENQEKEKSSAKKEKEVPHLVDFEKAVQLLNENSGRSFLVTDLDRKGKTDKYKKFAGLMAKGYVFEDIAAVIVEKCKEWRNDSKMNKYLQPATLFGSVKFEQYLEAVKAGEPNATKISTNSPLNDFHAKAQQRGFVGSIASLGRIFNRIKSKLPPDKTPEYALQRLEAFLNNAGTNDLEQINKKFDSILLKLKQNATTKNASTTQ